MRRGAAGAVLVALAIGVAACGSSNSPEDVAKSNGEKVGKAVKDLTTASNVSDIESAVADLQSAYKDVSKNVKDKTGQLTRQINAEKKTVTDAFDQVKQAAKSGNVTDLSSAVGVLQTSLTSIGEDAKSMASTTNSVAKAFWNGVEDGFEG